MFKLRSFPRGYYAYLGFRLNTCMYAPKDDDKSRSDLYDDDEADQ